MSKLASTSAEPAPPKPKLPKPWGRELEPPNGEKAARRVGNFSLVFVMSGPRCRPESYVDPRNCLVRLKGPGLTQTRNFRSTPLQSPNQEKPQVMGDAFTEYPLVRFKSQISACKQWEFQTIPGDADPRLIV